MAGPLAAAGKMKTLWNRNIFALLQKGSPWKAAPRRLCSKPAPEDGAQSPRPPAPDTSSYQPMYKNVVSPSKWHKRILLLMGRYKKEEDIPEFVSVSVIHAATSKLRAYIGSASIVLTLVMFFFAARSGKRAMEEGRSLRAVHMEKKAKLMEQTMQSSSPKV